jgi:hypothetical protein
MAIKNMYQIFLNQLDRIEKVREESAKTYEHKYFFPLNKTTQVIKSAFAAVVNGRRITKNNPGFTKGGDLEKFVDKNLDAAYYKIYTINNIAKEFEKRFEGAIIKHSSSKTNPGIRIIEGSYQQKRSGNIKRDRTIVTDNLLLDAVNELIELVANDFDAANPATDRMGNHLRSKHTTKNQYDNYDSRKVSGIGLGLHGGMNNDSTVAMIAVLEGIKKLSSRSLPQMSQAAVGAVQEETNKLNNIFGVRKNFKLNKHSLEQYIKNPKLIDTLEIDIEYGTNLSQSEMQEFDAKQIKAELEAARDAAIEGLKAEQEKWGKDYIAMKGSPSIKDKIEKGIPSTVAETLFKGQKVKGKYPKQKSKTTNKSKATKKTRQRTSKKISSKAAKGAKITYAKRKQQEQNNPIALKELINATLPQEILSRMHPPALVNRTGRFRNSAEVTNVMIGPRGGTQIDYTYMKYPYQTFEPGYAQGSTNRDPRRIIGASVREIAQKLTGNRFITTRSV